MSYKTVIILSGGMDSTTLAYDLKYRGHELHALSFNYGQRHSKELKCAAITCKKLNISHHVIEFPESLQACFKDGALTTNEAVPEGHYADENMKRTVVPNRNMTMLALATAYAITIGADNVAYGAHAGDHTIYPDCRPEFAEAMSDVMYLCHFTPINLLTPYMHTTKKGICAIGQTLDVPYQDTWTCYKGQDAPCGVCGSCVEREEAFAWVGEHDPLIPEG